MDSSSERAIFEATGIPRGKSGTPPVMTAKYKQNRLIMQQQFRAKNDILRTMGSIVPSNTYYQEIFGTKFFGKSAQERILTFSRSRRPHTHEYAQASQIPDDCFGRNDAYTYLMSFYQKTPREALVKTIYGLTVDLDHVTLDDLEILKKEDFYGYRPTYCVNSGSGVHLVYLLTEPVSFFRFRAAAIKETYAALRDHFAGRGASYEVDAKCGLVHGFRVVGSETKIGTVCSAWRVGEKWELAEIANSFCINIPQDAPNYQKSKENHKAKEVAAEKAGKLSKLPRPNNWYKSTLNQAYQNVEGHRETSLFATAIIGIAKCGMRPDKVLRDLENLRDYYNKRDGKAIAQDQPKRVQEYVLRTIEIARMTKKTTLEKYLGIRYGENAVKRNGRTQVEHLSMIADKKKQTNILKVRRALECEPQATQARLEELTGISRKTIRKYLKMMDAVVAQEPDEVMQKPDVASEVGGCSPKKPMQEPPAEAYLPLLSKTKPVSMSPSEVNSIFQELLETTNQQKQTALAKRLPPEHRARVEKLQSAGVLPFFPI